MAALATAFRRALLGWTGCVAIAAPVSVGLALYPKALFSLVLICSARVFVAARALDAATVQAARTATVELIPAARGARVLEPGG